MSFNLGASGEQTLDLQYPLHKACRDGDQERLTALLSAGQYDLYEEDGYYGWTPTHWASYFGKLNCLMTLTEHGYHSDSVTSRLNQSPLHIAALGGNGHCLKWLIHCGASVNRQLACLRKLISELKSGSACNLSTKSSGVTPVHVAALGGQPHCLLWLLQAGGHLGAQDYLGDTPIHKAARAGSMECISLLLSQNAAIDMKNYNGQTPCEVAKNSSHTQCGEYLGTALKLQQSGQLNSTMFNISNIKHNQVSKELNGINGHTAMHNGDLNGDAIEDCDMEMERCPHPHDQNEVHNICNGLHSGANGSKEVTEVFPKNGCGDEGSSVFRAFSGIKRSMDDEEDEGIKRRCVREGKCEETPLNNNILSSYHSILAISTAPVKTDPVCSSEVYHPSYHLTRESFRNEEQETDSISESALEHSLSLQEQRGYDGLLAASLLYMP